MSALDWNRARAFLATAEAGSLSAAAKTLGLTQSTLSRQVAAFEKDLGLILFDRVGRGLALTQSGVELVEYVKAMASAADTLALRAAGRKKSVKGTVSISATDIAAAYRLPEFLRAMRRDEPDIHIEIIASTTATNMKDREADIAIRHFEPTEKGLVGERAYMLNHRFYATPQYLASLGTVHAITDYSRAEFIGFDRSDRQIQAFNGTGLTLTNANFPLVSMNQFVQWSYVKAGLGIGLIGQDVGDADPNVVRAVPEATAIEASVWVVTHRELYLSQRVKTIYDRLLNYLRESKPNDT
ncbi:MAG: LysR family transcriptional regulator [Pseudomonadota bacterium]